jgi:lysozyme
MAQAESLFAGDMQWAADNVADAVTVPLTPGQFDALVSIVFNIGTGAFRRSTLLKKLNRRMYADAANEFLRWDKVTNPVTGAKEVSAGLVKRRQAERALFLSPGPGVPG